MISFVYLNDLNLTEAEEKMVKMKEDYTKTKENETLLVDEIEKLRKKIALFENKMQPSNSSSSLNYLKQNKGIKSKIFYFIFR